MFHKQYNIFVKVFLIKNKLNDVFFNFFILKYQNNEEISTKINLIFFKIKNNFKKTSKNGLNNKLTLN